MNLVFTACGIQLYIFYAVYPKLDKVKAEILKDTEELMYVIHIPHFHGPSSNALKSSLRKISVIPVYKLFTHLGVQKRCLSSRPCEI